MANYSPGNKPITLPDGSYMGPRPGSFMADPGPAPDLTEQVALGAGKARYAVVDSKYDYRNFRRSKPQPTGKVT